MLEETDQSYFDLLGRSFTRFTAQKCILIDLLEVIYKFQEVILFKVLLILKYLAFDKQQADCLHLFKNYW